MISKREKIFFQINYLLLALACVSIPWTIYLLLPIMILLFINWLAECNFKVKFHRMVENKTLPFFILSVGFFFLNVIGLLYSVNKSFAWSNLECKMWFLGIPIVILTANPLLLTRKKIEKLFYLFLFSCLIVVVINFVWSLVDYIKTGDSWHLVYYNLTHLLPSRPMHPSYLALYATFSSFFAFYQLYYHSQSLKKIVKIILWISIVFFALLIFFLQSKAGILTYYFLLILMVVIFINQKRKRWGLSVVTVVLMIGIGYLLLQITPHGRMKAAFNELSHNIETEIADPEYVPQSSGQRLMAWENSWEVIKNNFFFGVGTGDAMDKLMIEYQEKGLKTVLQKELNAHNQFIQTTMALGIVGFLFLVLFLLYPFYCSIKEKDFLLFFFIMAVGINLLVESMFEVRAGSVFIPLFYSLLAYRLKCQKES